VERAKFLVSNVSKEVAFAMGGDYIHSSSPLGTGKFFVRYVPLEAAKVSLPMIAVTDSSESSSLVSESKVGGKAAVAASESVEAAEPGDKESDEVAAEAEEDGVADLPTEVGSAEEDDSDEGDDSDNDNGADDDEMPVLKFFYHPYNREFWSSNYVKLFTPPKSSRWLERLDKKYLR